MFQTKAKKFNTQKQRVIDGDHHQILREAKKEERKFGGLKNKKTKRSAGLPGNNKSKWQKQSEAFRNAMRAARGAKPLDSGYGGGAGMGGGGFDDNDDFVPCPT